MKNICCLYDVPFVLLMSSLTLRIASLAFLSDSVPSSPAGEDKRLSFTTEITSSWPPTANLPSQQDQAMSADTCLSVGDDLTMNCSLYDPLLDKYNARNIRFKVYQFKTTAAETGSGRWISSSNVRALNNTSAMLTVVNVSLQDGGQYSCFACNSSCQEGQVIQYVGSSDVRVEYAVQNVTDFQCTVYNWDASMTCTWAHPVHYVNWARINVTSSFRRTTSTPQPCFVPSTISCRWYNGTFFVSVNNYSVQVNVTNTCTRSLASKTFTFSTLHSVKPAPVEELTARAVDNPTQTGCILLAWNHPSQRRDKLFRIQHQDVGTGHWETLESNTSRLTFETCGYHPYTYHNFSVDCQPTGVYSGYWSEPVYKDVWSAMTVPDLGPRTTNGSYWSTKCVDGLRNVTLMWQEVEKSARNGPIDGYLVRQGETTLQNITVEEYSVLVELPCDQRSDLSIYAYNEVGLSRIPSVLVVSPDSLIPSQITDSFSAEIITDIISGEQIYLSWEVDEQTNHRMFTVFWCEGQGQTCKSNISWSHVPDTETSCRIQIPSSEAGRYLYGISVTDKQTGRTSGISWTTCLFTRVPYFVPAVQNLDVTSLVESVFISWSAQLCMYQPPVKITNFNIKWGPTVESGGYNVSGPGRISVKTVPASTTSWTVPSLEANTNYTFTVQPVSFNVKGDEVQPWKTATPSAPEFSVNLGAVIGGLVGAISVLIVNLLVIRNCRTRKRKLDPKITNSRSIDIANTHKQPNSRPLTLGTSGTTLRDQHTTTATTASPSLSQKAEIRSDQENNCQVPCSLLLKESYHCPSKMTSSATCTTHGDTGGGSSTLQIAPDDTSETCSRSMGIEASNYIQLNMPASHSDGGSQSISPQTSLEMQTIDNSSQVVRESEACTSLSHESNNSLKSSLPSNCYSRMMENNVQSAVSDPVQLECCSKSESDSLSIDPGYVMSLMTCSKSESDSLSIDPGYVMSFLNGPNLQPDHSEDLQQDYKSLYITDQSSPHTHSHSPLSNSIRLRVKMNVGITTETGGDEEVSKIALDLNESELLTESTNPEIIYIDPTVLQNSHPRRENVSVIEQAGIQPQDRSDLSNEASTQQSNMDNLSCNTHCFAGYSSDLSEIICLNGDTSFSLTPGSDSDSCPGIDSQPIIVDYVQLRELSSNDTDRSDQSHSDNDTDYIQH